MLWVLIRPEKYLFKVKCQKNTGRAGTVFVFFTLKSCRLYSKSYIFLVFSEIFEKKIRIH